MPEEKSHDAGGDKRPTRESSEVGVLGLVIFSLTLFLTVALIMVVAKVMLDHLAAGRPEPVKPPAAVELSTVPPKPRLQTSPRLDLKELLAVEDQEMKSYGWVDRKAGIIQIPVDRALDLVARHGLPEWEATAEAVPPAGKGKKKEGTR